MHRQHKFITLCFLMLIAARYELHAQEMSLKNGNVTVVFGDRGITSIEDHRSNSKVKIQSDEWSLQLDDTQIRSLAAKPKIVRSGTREISYQYATSGYTVEAVYNLEPNYKFVSKQLKIVRSPRAAFVVQQVVPLDISLDEVAQSVQIPTTHIPREGAPLADTKARSMGGFGAFLRLSDDRGMLLTVQNPFLTVSPDGNIVHVSYKPDMRWEQSWGSFSSDVACLGTYHLSGRRIGRGMVVEWNQGLKPTPQDGADYSEIESLTDCVRAFLITPSAEPLSLVVGWTLNDYQIDVGTSEGESEYKRIIDTVAELGIHNVLYAPSNSKLARMDDDADDWNWEHTLWLGLGQQIRKGQWNPEVGKLPPSVVSMLKYGKSKQVKLIAYVYPSLPFTQDSSWLVTRAEKDGGRTYATLASRSFQDFMIRNLVTFRRRTGIAGYAFDHTWLNLPGSSYAQWWGWRRVMESLRRAEPDIIIDGRQSYQHYGPWTWLAGSYPHPTGGDEQPESFRPFPDLHFDRVSANRQRFINYWYRNYEFAPDEILPGYATHQTERLINVSQVNSAGENTSDERVVYTRFRPRDWDYLGYRYSILSALATGGWNAVIGMIPARDPEELAHFSAADKQWIRDWLQWAKRNKEFLRNTRTIIGQPALGRVDGTSAIVGDRGFLFLFNPNYRETPAKFRLDDSINLSVRKQYMLREVYPRAGRLIGKPNQGVWDFGDEVELPLHGTTATVVEVLPADAAKETTPLFNAPDETHPNVSVQGHTLRLTNVAGEPQETMEVGVLLPADTSISEMFVNGRSKQFEQHGRYVSTQAQFRGVPFTQAQEVKLTTTGGTLSGSFVVPSRVFSQMEERRKAWPIPWTHDDYDTTWLAPERLLLFIPFATPSDEPKISADLDGKPLPLTKAYSSVRSRQGSFVGFYADLSQLQADVEHHLSLHIPPNATDGFQGVYFDNVEPMLSTDIF